MAPDKSGAVSLVWITRQAFKSAEQKLFFTHVKTLSKTGVFGELSYGVDPAGMGYVTLESESPKKLDFDKPDVSEMRRRFVESVLAVEKLHAAGIVLGTLTHDSFIIEQNNRVRCIEVFGRCGLEATSEVPLEMRIYQPPAGTESRWPSTDLDVRSLAIAGLRLFGAQFPPSGIVTSDFSTYLTRIPREAPAWVSQVLEKIVSQPDRILYRDASELLGVIVGTERAAKQKRLQGDASAASGEDSGVSLDEMVRLIHRKPAHSRVNRLSRIFDRATRRVMLQFLVVCGCGALAFAAYGWFQEARESEKGRDSIPAIDESSIKESVGGITGPQKSVSGAVDESQPGSAKLVEDTAGQDFGALTELLRAGLASVAGVPKGMRELIHELRNVALSDSDRRQKLIEKEESSPEVVARVAAATALDRPEMEESLREILIRGVQRLVPGLPTEDLQKVSIPALIFAIDLRDELPMPAQATFAARISKDELWWLLSLHAKKRAIKITKTAEVAIASAIASWPQRIFLELIKRSDSSTNPPYEGLVRAAREGPTVGDVEDFGAWYSPLGELALYGVLVSSQDRDRLQGAIEGLLGTPMSSERAMASFIEALRTNESTVIVEYSRLIGAIGLNRELPADVFAGFFTREALSKLNSAAQRVLIEKSSSGIVQSFLGTAGADIHPDTLIMLLEHEDPEVRKAVIPLLKNLPLASSRDRVQKMYSLERDQSVVQLYQQELGMAEQ
jgi:hypothetical protein